MDVWIFKWLGDITSGGLSMVINYFIMSLSQRLYPSNASLLVGLAREKRLIEIAIRYKTQGQNRHNWIIAPIQIDRDSLTNLFNFQGSNKQYRWTIVVSFLERKYESDKPSWKWPKQMANDHYKVQIKQFRP